ncbi:MAG: hypothetical protein HY289_00330, partial [Planctomycetes bacterium]|nr:hypothetical protein [Planctomycetota bacterium]
LPALHVDLEGAFPRLTAEVPEIIFSIGDAPTQKLRLRWYKITGEHDAASWVAKLHARKHEPLAIIGGGTSDRALKLAYTLKKTYGEDPDQPAPAFLITTATAEKTTSGKSLIDVYRQRTFRFSFTNQKMVEAMLAFVTHREYPEKEKEWAQSLWVSKPDPAFPNNGGPGTMYAVTWEDERYSKDMNELFEREFNRLHPKNEFSPEGTIPYSVGGFLHPGPQEQLAVGTFLARAREKPIVPNSFLVLPTQTARMRRFLIPLRLRSPENARKFVVMNGDSVSFHSVYRDREVMWNISELPYSLVFFSHRTPIDRAAGFRWTKEEKQPADAFPKHTTTGTHDLLLYRDLFEAILYAAYDQGRLLGDSAAVRQRLQATCWYHAPLDRLQHDPARVCNPRVHSFEPATARFFDDGGNRQSRTGEHIVWVKPSFTDDIVDLVSKISVWTMQPNANGGAWRLVEGGAFDATYNQSRAEDMP